MCKLGKVSLIAAVLLLCAVGPEVQCHVHKLKRLDDGHNAGFEATEASVAGRQFPKADVADKCDQMHSLAERLVVVARHGEDISWLQNYVDAPYLAYNAANDVTQNHTRKHDSGANEASAYLTFIAEYYNCLPQATAFIHAHQSSYHSADMALTLKRLNWTAVPGYLPAHEHYFQPWGMYHQLRCAHPETELQTVLAKNASAPGGELYSPGQIVNGTAYENSEVYRHRQGQDVLNAWEEFFGPAGLGPAPELIQYYCCAQFVVTKERIQSRPRDFYLQALYYSNHGQHLGYFPPAYTRGLVFELVWHIIFGEPAVLPRQPSSLLCRYFKCEWREARQELIEF